MDPPNVSWPTIQPRGAAYLASTCPLTRPAGSGAISAVSTAAGPAHPIGHVPDVHADVHRIHCLRRGAGLAWNWAFDGVIAHPQGLDRRAADFDEEALMMAASKRRTQRPAATAAVDVRVAPVAAMARPRAGRPRTTAARRESHKGHRTCDHGRRPGVEPASARHPVRSAGHPHLQAGQAR